MRGILRWCGLKGILRKCVMRKCINMVRREGCYERVGCERVCYERVLNEGVLCYPDGCFVGCVDGRMTGCLV